MEARELRIGNWVLIEKIPQQTIDVMCDSLNTYNFHGAHYGLIEPIPLTEEWLLKFGFDFFASNNSWQLDTELGFCIWGRIGNGLEVFVESNSCGISIKYVHQLQNLFFALTGQELTIKQETK